MGLYSVDPLTRIFQEMGPKDPRSHNTTPYLRSKLLIHYVRVIGRPKFARLTPHSSSPIHGPVSRLAKRDQVPTDHPTSRTTKVSKSKEISQGSS